MQATSGVWGTDEVMSECVLLTYSHVIHTVMMMTPVPQTLGNSKVPMLTKNWPVYAETINHSVFLLDCDLRLLPCRDPIPRWANLSPFPAVYQKPHPTPTPLSSCINNSASLIQMSKSEKDFPGCCCWYISSSPFLYVSVLASLRPFISSISPVRVPGPSPIVLSTREQALNSPLTVASGTGT